MRLAHVLTPIVLLMTACAKPNADFFEGSFDLPIIDGAEAVACEKLLEDDHNFEFQQVCLERPVEAESDDPFGLEFYAAQLRRRGWVEVSTDPSAQSWAWPAREPAEFCLDLMGGWKELGSLAMTRLLAFRFSDDWAFRRTCGPESAS